MKRLQSVALVFALAVMATGAHAGGNKFSLLNCGLKLGGTAKQQQTSTAPQKRREEGSRQAAKTFDASRLGVTTYSGAVSNSTGRRKMAPKFTFAKAGCSW